MIAAAAVTACMANYLPDPFDLLNANIEALAQDESLDPGESGNQGIVCQFKSKVKPVRLKLKPHIKLLQNFQ